MTKGLDLFEKVFGEDVDFNLYEIEDIDGVTDFVDFIAYNEGWYNHHEVAFSYEGAQYTFTYKDHTSDNVCETTIDYDSFTRMETPLQETIALDMEESFERMADALETYCLANTSKEDRMDASFRQMVQALRTYREKYPENEYDVVANMTFTFQKKAE